MKADEIERVRQDIAVYLSYHLGGDRNSAVDAWRRIESIAKESSVARSEVASMLRESAQFHLNRREFFAAEPLLARCESIERYAASARDSTGDDHLGLINVLILWTNLYLAQRTPELAEKPASEALHLAEQIDNLAVGFDRDQWVAVAACQLALVKRRLCNRNSAKELYLRALLTYRRNADEIQDRTLLYDTVTNLATLHLEMGDIESAEGLFREVYEKLVQAYGEADPRSAYAHAHVAFVERMNGLDQHVMAYDRLTEVIRAAVGTSFCDYVDHFEHAAKEKLFAGDAIDAQIDLAIVEEIRKRFKDDLRSAEKIDFRDIMQAFVSGDYANTIRKTEKHVGPHTTLELARIRLICLQRLQQYESASELSSSLIASLDSSPFDLALIDVLNGMRSREEVLKMAKDVNEYGKALYYVAARLRTEEGFDAAHQTLLECVNTDANCFEKLVAEMELDTTDSASAPSQTIQSWKPGDLIEQTYRVESINTQGAMSFVYFARHERWNIDVAIKVPRPAVLSQQSARERLSDEANTWVNLGVHPNIVNAYYVKRIGGIPAIVMEKIDGGSLKDALAEGRFTELKDTVDVAIQVAVGLAYAAEKIPGFVHRDVKPANVLLASDGTALLTDFGLSNLSGSAAGTPAYMAPEAWTNFDQIDSASDIYSFGVMLFEMLTGRRPFGQHDGDRSTEVPDSIESESDAVDETRSETNAARPDLQATESWSDDGVEKFRMEPIPIRKLVPNLDLMRSHLEKRPPSPRSLRDDISIDLSTFCMRMLEKKPGARPSASQVVTELTSIYEVMTGEPYSRGIPENHELGTQSLNNHALSMLDLGRAKEAERLWKEANEASPLNVAVTFNTGLRAWRKGDITDIDLLERLTDIATADPESVSYLKALVHLEREDAAAAIAELEGVENTLVANRSAVNEIRRRAFEAESENTRRFITLKGHTDWITAIGIKGDGSTAITSSRDQTLRSWNLESDGDSKILGRHHAPITSVDFSDDWSTAVSIDADGVLNFWDLEIGQCSQAIETGHKLFGMVVMSRDGGKCLTSNYAPGDQTQQLRLWDSDTRTEITAWNGMTSGINSIFISSDRDLVIATDWKTMGFWRVPNSECIHMKKIPDCMLPRRPIAFNASGDQMVTSFENVELVLLETETQRVVRRFAGHKDAVLHLAVSADLNRIVSSDADATVRLWDVQTGRCVHTFKVVEDGVTALGVSADGKKICVGTEGGDVLAFNWPKASFSAHFVLSRPFPTNKLLEISELVRLAVSKAESAIDDGDFSSALNTIRQARAADGCNYNSSLLGAWFRLYPHFRKCSLKGAWKSRAFGGQATYVQAVRLSECGGSLLSTSRDGVTLIRNAKTGDLLQTLLPSQKDQIDKESHDEHYEHNPPQTCWSADISSDGHLAAVVDIAIGRIRIFDTVSGDCLKDICVGFEKVVSVCFTWQADRIVVGSADGVVHVHDVSTANRIYCLHGHSDVVTAMAINESNQLVTASEDQTIRIWDLDEAKCLLTFGADESGPLQAAKHYFESAMLRGEKSYSQQIRAHFRSLPDYLHRPMRMRAEIAMAICVDKNCDFVLRAMGSRMEFWRITGPVLETSIETHAGLILCADMSPDAHFAVTAGADRRIRIWSLFSGQCLKILHCEEEPWSVRFDRNVGVVFSGEYGSVTEWTLDWEITDSVTTNPIVSADRQRKSIIPSPNDSSNLVHLIDQFLSTENETGEESALGIVQHPWESLRDVRPMLVKRIPALITKGRSAESEQIDSTVVYLLSAAGAAAVGPLQAHLGDTSPRFRQLVVAALGNGRTYNT